MAKTGRSDKNTYLHRTRERGGGGGGGGHPPPCDPKNFNNFQFGPLHQKRSLRPQALHGLAPKRELINIHELIKESTINYVTLLPLENCINLNAKG